MDTEQLILLSEIIDKMEIAEELKKIEINTGNQREDTIQLGKEILFLISTRLYKCKREIFTFVALYKGYLPNEEDFSSQEEYNQQMKLALKKAKQENVIEIFKQIGSQPGIADFLHIA